MTDTGSKRIYRRPEIVADDEGRLHLTKASWNNETMTLHLLARGINSWITVGDLAKLVWGRNTENFRKAVRQRLPGLKRYIALSYNQLLVVEYNDVRGSASAVKIYDAGADGDVHAMQRMLKDMRNRKDGMLTYYEKVTGLSGIEPDNQQ